MKQEQLTIENKRTILFTATLNAEMDNSADFIYNILWEGSEITGYANASAEEIESEWQDTIKDMSPEEIQQLIDDVIGTE